MIFGLVDLDCPKFFLISSNEKTCGHLNKLFVRHSRVDVRKYFFGNHIVKIWNSLPALYSRRLFVYESLNVLLSVSTCPDM